MTLLSPLTLLLAVTATFAYNCPPTGTFYHADATTNCRVYHLCENSVMTTFQCPDGQIFDHHTMVCADPSTTHCAELHHMHKRSTPEESMVHTIAIDELKQGLRLFYETVKESAKDTLKEVAPTVHERLSEDYGKTTKAIREDVLPIVRERVLPRVKKAYEYSKIMGVKMFKKVYKSYQLSNDTHISIVSFKDIIEELSNDIKPVLNLGRYLSSRLAANANTRAKRHAPSSFEQEVVSEVMASLMSPAVRYVAGTIGGMVTGTEDSITSKILVPVLSEMFQDPETAFDMRRIFWSTKAVVAHLVDHLLKMQDYQTPEGTLIRIPREDLIAAKTKFFVETKPIIGKVIERHLPMILKRSADNFPVIQTALSRLQATSGAHYGVLQDSVMRFIFKHAPVMTSSTDKEHVLSYTLTEIQNDFRPIKVTLIQILLDYFTKTPGSFLNAAFDRNSEFYRSFMGKEVYATPNAEFYKSQKALSAKHRSIKQRY